jgi:hypothetical protein
MDREKKKFCKKKILLFCGNESKLGKWDVKRAKMHTVKKSQVTKLNILNKIIHFLFDSIILLNNKYLINCHNLIYVISKLTVQETIDVMLETPKKNWQMEEIISSFFSLTPTQLYYTNIQKKEIVKCSFNS